MPTGPPRSAPPSPGASLLVAVEVVGLAAAAHAVAGGGWADPGYLLALAALVFTVSLGVARGALRLATTLPAVTAAQAGLHLAFAHGTHTVHGTHSVSAPIDLVGTAQAPSTMLAAHAVTALITAVLLTLQAPALSRLGAWLQRPCAPAPVPLHPDPPAPRATGPVSGRRRPLLDSAPRRGPPPARPAEPARAPSRPLPRLGHRRVLIAP